MRELFLKRTEKHIRLVVKNLEQFEGYLGLTLSELRGRGSIHDQSKFSADEEETYTWLTWLYHCQKEGVEFQMTPAIQEIVSTGLKKHASQNRHHPEAHAHPDEMTLLDMAEMVADWTAIAEEHGRSSSLSWAQENVGKKWNFSDEKKNMIFELIGELDRRNGHAV